MPDISFLNFILLALASYRLTLVLTTDVVFDDVRNKIWEKFPPHTHKFGYLFTCNWCMSIWTSSLITVCYTIVPTATIVVALPFALSAVVGILSSKVDH